jgi:ribosome biogenesis GTPase
MRIQKYLNKISIQVVKKEESEMELKDLGWDEFFQRQVDDMDIGDAMVGRVFRMESQDILGILTQEGEMNARVPGKMKYQESELPAIGDWVIIEPKELSNTIIKVLKRKNKISRKMAGREYKEQVVGANIDYIFIVMGLDRDYNINRLERYLFMVSAANSEPVVILNKIDLAEGGIEKKLEKVRAVAEGLPIHPISALNKEGLDTIRNYLKKGITISLVGSSGAGKSTLINALLGEQKQETGEVRKGDSKGRHITATRELFLIPDGGIIIDNPGIREIQLWGDMDSLDYVFSDIQELSARCKFRDCNHISEPKCAVKHAVEEGTLSKQRYENYLKMKKELDFLQKKAQIGTEAAEKERWRGILKDTKKYMKYKDILKRNLVLLQ